MRVLIVSQYFWPESFRINELAAALVVEGCEVTVLTGQPNYPDGATFAGYRAFSVNREAHEGVTIHRVPLAPRGRAGAKGLIANYLSFLFFGCLLGPWLLRGQRFDVVFVYGTSPILKIFVALAVRLFCGGKLVSWVQDLWPESLRVTGFVRNERALNTVGAVVAWLYRRNDLLLVQSHGFVPLVSAMAGRTPVEYFPNPGEKAYLQEAAPQHAPLQLKPGFNVVFAGNLGTVQALDTVVEAATLLREEPQIRFVLVGSGSRGEWLHSEIARRGLNNVELPGRFPPQAMPGILSQASALLVSLARDPVISATIPSKVQAYLATGRPLIASMDGEGARVVQEAGAGRVCPAEDAQALADAVRQLHACSQAEQQRLGDAARTYYLDHFEPQKLAARLVQRFQQLTQAPA
jgi:glycosyltransferase involved in cell wall biosynthesis